MSGWKRALIQVEVDLRDGVNDDEFAQGIINAVLPLLDSEKARNLSATWVASDLLASDDSGRSA